VGVTLVRQRRLADREPLAEGVDLHLELDSPTSCHREALLEIDRDCVRSLQLCPSGGELISEVAGAPVELAGPLFRDQQPLSQLSRAAALVRGFGSNQFDLVRRPPRLVELGQSPVALASDRLERTLALRERR